MASKGIQTEYGKAFEYACLVKINDNLLGRQKVFVEKSPQLNTAKEKFESVDEDLRAAMVKAAEAAYRVIFQSHQIFMLRLSHGIQR